MTSSQTHICSPKRCKQTRFAIHSSVYIHILNDSLSTFQVIPTAIIGDPKEIKNTYWWWPRTCSAYVFFAMLPATCSWMNHVNSLKLCLTTLIRTHTIACVRMSVVRAYIWCACVRAYVCACMRACVFVALLWRHVVCHTAVYVFPAYMCRSSFNQLCPTFLS